ncbi:glycosyltransferase [Cetobacterium sp.]|uniref:glycosyltransferase n=1 Tax=Cetobacterium sp. TaxID=2071632 RepID=UPI003F3CBE10
MKKLAIINHNLGSGGAEKLIYDIALELHKRKIDFSVILLTSKNCIYGAKLLDMGIDVKYLSCKWDIYSFKNIFRLKKVLKDYDIIHTHIYSAQLWTAFVSYFLSSNKKFITTEHSTSNNRRGKFLFKLLDKWMYSRYNSVVSITLKTKESLESWIKIKYKSYIVPNGININKYLNADSLKREEIGLKKDDIVITQIARFNSVKNHETTIKALNELPKEYKVVFLGEGESEKELKKLCEKLNLLDRVKFLGYRDDIPKILKISDVSILTSSYEGLPISTLESMLLNPFIGSDVPGIKELVEGYGLLFQFKNHIDLKNKILILMESKKNYNLIKKRCCDKAKEYSIEKTVDQYLNIYER